MIAGAALTVAILTEVGATISLRASVGGHKLWYLAIIGGYLLSFVSLALALDAGIGLGVAYGIWAAGGTALTAVASKYLFKDPLTGFMAAGIALIAGGVLLIEVGAY